MADPTTTGGGSSGPAPEPEHRERAQEIAGERGESTLAATNGAPRSLPDVLDLVLADAYRDSSGYYLIRPHTLDEVRRMAHVVRGLVPKLETPIKADFTLLPPPPDHRLVQRELLLELPPDAYLRGLALDWPDGKAPRLVWTWSEPAPEVRHA